MPKSRSYFLLPDSFIVTLSVVEGLVVDEPMLRQILTEQGECAQHDFKITGKPSYMTFK